jgi:diaminopimelate decarboxylase
MSDEAWAGVHCDVSPSLRAAIGDRATPFFVLDAAQVERRARSFVAGAARATPRVACAYPFKANPLAVVTRAAVGVYGQAEVATIDELELAAASTEPPSNILVGGIAKSADTLLRAAELGATIKIDSEGELARLRSVWPRLEEHDTWSLLLRIALPENDGWSRFGMLREDACRAAASQEPWTRRLRGVHFHAGTSFRDPAPFADATRWCAPVLEAVSELDHVERVCLDVGGGYPNVPDRDVEATAATFVGAVANALRDAGFGSDTVDVVCEPGRITVERTGVLVASVVERARATNDAVVVDVGSTLAGGSWAPVRAGRSIVFSNDADTAATSCDVYGNLCHEGDVVAEGAIIVRDSSVPGIAIMGDVGAYRLAAAAPWMQKLPTVYELRDDQLVEVRPALTLEHFTA